MDVEQPSGYSFNCFHQFVHTSRYTFIILAWVVMSRPLLLQEFKCIISTDVKINTNRNNTNPNTNININTKGLLAF